MAKKKSKSKKEALSVGKLINEVLVSQLGISINQIVNDSKIGNYTGNDRPDLLISNVEYNNNDDEFVKNLLCYVEAKDVSCNVGDNDWNDAYNQGCKKAPKLGNMPFFGVTNCRTTYFYNTETGEKLTLNGNIISEFQTLDVFRIIKQQLRENPKISNIKTGVDTLSRVSEAVFNKKLWELKEEYREIDFSNNTQKIDFTIGMIALEYYEEKSELDGTKDSSKEYWSDGKQYVPKVGEDIEKAKHLKILLVSYIERLEEDEGFKEFAPFLEPVKSIISGNNAKISPLQLQAIYPIIDSMKPMHGTGFDLFGAVYENFADTKEKRDFGEYFTRRHYAHVLAELLLKDEDVFDVDRKIKIMDPSCGTGGMLTESFKVLKNNYENTNTYTEEAQEHLSKKCFYGIDIRSENISRTRLNMFLVGDGHTNMYQNNSLKPEKKEGSIFLENNQYDYIITNPPYGAGTVMAATDVLNSFRMEVAFIYKNIDLLNIGGRACVITPDGILENPSFKKLRQELMEVCKIEAIVSLPKFAFAPYTKEKTYAIFFQKKHKRNYNPNEKKGSRPTGKFQEDPIWMYIIDNDGYANSDKRFPTRLRGDNQQWLHDEVSGYSDDQGIEKKSILVQKWKIADDKATNGTEWLTDKGQKVKLRKCGFIDISDITNDNYFTLLPEKYLRPYEPNFLDENEFSLELLQIEDDIKKLLVE